MEFKMDKADRRLVCKYGSKCFRKNPEHLAKFKHPAKRPLNSDNSPERKKQKIEEIKTPISNNISDSDSEESQDKIQSNEEKKELSIASPSDDSQQSSSEELLTDNPSDYKEFIKSRFLVDMPKDFYQFWEFCKSISKNKPADALKCIDLELVGPFDVLQDKFKHFQEKSLTKFLIHWRYYYDPPEFQTIIKGDDSKGFHIGYFRDDPKEEPIFVVSNKAKVDGIIEVLGPNIFAALYNYSEEFNKNANPFKKVEIAKLQSSLKAECNKFNIELTKTNSKIRERNRNVVTKLFNKIGLVVPYNKKTELGYRELALNDKDLHSLLGKLKKALDEQKSKYLSDLQPVLTYASIATDECDFGTGLELGSNLLFYGIDSLNGTIARFLSSSYNLLNRNEFAKISDAHMANRRKTTSLSIL